MEIRKNDQIHASELRVIGPDGKQRGVLSRADALALARSFRMDLVEIAPNATPPVARIVDFARFCEEQRRRARQGNGSAYTNN